jgi:hypothetical protein
VDADLSIFREDFDGSTFVTHVEGEDPVTARGSENIKVYQPGVEAAWSTTLQLCKTVELVIQEAWQGHCCHEWRRRSTERWILDPL